MSTALDRVNDQLLSGFLERDHVGTMCGILKNSGKEQTFHGENVVREYANNAGRRFFDLFEVDNTERSLRACTAADIKTYGPNLAQLKRVRTASERAGRKGRYAIRACDDIHMSDDAKENLDNGKTKHNS